MQPLLLGGNPFKTTSIYSLIHFLERAHGVYFAMGGTGATIQALEKLMRQQGIDIQVNTTAVSILIEDGVARGVTLEDGRILSADILIANADAAHLYTNMIKKSALSWITRIKLATAHYSMGLFVLYFGTRKQYTHVAHHTVWMGARYKDLLADIFEQKILANDFSLYVHRPTATDPSFAPKGCDSFYVLCPVPNLQGKIDWQKEGPTLQKRIVAALGQSLLPGLENVMEADFYMTPEDFQHNYLSMHGAGFSIAPLFRQSSWFRFHNRAEKIKNLYLVGAGTHPGAGVPGVLCSAKVIDKLITSLS